MTRAGGDEIGVSGDATGRHCEESEGLTDKPLRLKLKTLASS